MSSTKDLAYYLNYLKENLSNVELYSTEEQRSLLDSSHGLLTFAKEQEEKLIDPKPKENVHVRLAKHDPKLEEAILAFINSMKGKADFDKVQAYRGFILGDGSCKDEYSDYGELDADFTAKRLVNLMRLSPEPHPYLKTFIDENDVRILANEVTEDFIQNKGKIFQEGQIMDMLREKFLNKGQVFEKTITRGLIKHFVRKVEYNDERRRVSLGPFNINEIEGIGVVKYDIRIRKVDQKHLNVVKEARIKIEFEKKAFYFAPPYSNAMQIFDSYMQTKVEEAGKGK